MINDPESRWLDTSEASQYLKLSPYSVRRYASLGLIAHTKTPGIQGRYRFRLSALDDFLAKKKPSQGSYASSPHLGDCPTLVELMDQE